MGFSVLNWFVVSLAFYFISDIIIFSCKEPLLLV